ncbi:MAG: hypothetical protein WBA17_17290 [Saprospiraceae bacterium]
MRPIHYLLVLIICLPLGAFAQQQLPGDRNIYNTQGPGFVYNKEWTFNLLAYTPRSFGIGMKVGKISSYDKMSFWAVELSDMRHPRELRSNFEKVIIQTNRVSRAFILGKQNNFYTIRAGLGGRTYVSEKAKQRGVAVGYSWQAGPTLGLLKPYYLEIDTGEPGGGAVVSDVKFNGDNAELFLDRFRIFGASNWSRGLSETKLRPGVHAKFAVHLGLGAFDEFAKSLEVGVQADYFFTEIPLMVESDLTPGIENTPLFLNFFVALQLGKRM